MLRHLNITPGDRVLIESRAYSFTGEITREGASPSDPRDLGFKDVRTAAHLTLELERFHRLYAAGEIRLLRAYEQPRDRLKEDPAEEDDKSPDVRWRRLWCEAYDRAPCSKSDVALKAFIARHAAEIEGDRIPSAGALRVWLRERGAPGDRRSRFMGERRGRERRGEGAMPLRIHPAVQVVLGEAAEAYYDGVRVNPESVYCATRTAVVELNARRAADGLPVLRPPSASTVRRYLRRHLDYGRATRRYGYREGGRRFTPIRGSVSAKHILEIAIIDQTLIDCSVIDDEHLINAGRPWLAMMIDVHSRYPLGFCLSFEPPSVETVLACLRHAVRPKLELEETLPELKDQWLAFGVPDTIVVDNAWENTGSSFRDACADAGVSITYAPVATPEYKGVCERFFGTLNTMLFHRLPGGLPFTPQQRSKLGLDNDKDAALLLSDVRTAIYQCIVEVYGRQFHKALQASPEQVWRKDAALHGRPYVDDLASLDIALAKLVPGERTLSRAGVTLHDLTYRAPEQLAELLADLLPLQAPRSAKPGTARVKVKYHAEDLSRIYVWNPVASRYVVLPCVQATYAEGLSEHHHGLIRAFAREEHLAFQSEDERCAARVRLQQRVLPILPLNKVRARQNAQRIKGEPPIAAVPVCPPAPEHAILLSSATNRSDGGEPHRAPGRSKTKRPKSYVPKPAMSDGPPIDAAQLFAEHFSAEQHPSSVWADAFEAGEGAS